MDVKHERVDYNSCNAMTTKLQEPGRVKVEGDVAEGLHVQREIVYINIKQEEIDVKVYEDKAEEKCDPLEHTTSTAHGDSGTHYACPICKYKTASQDNLADHLRIHCDEKLHKCSVCDYKTIHKRSIALHMVTHTGEKPYACSLCNYKAARKDTLATHMKTHTEEKPYSCSTCEYEAKHKTTQKSTLLIHMANHTGERPYLCSCSTCQYKSASNANLKQHLRTHTRKKPYTCEYKTAKKARLVRHIRTYSGENLYSCPTCDYKAAVKKCIM